MSQTQSENGVANRTRQVNESLIEDSLENRLSRVYAEVLEEHDIETGDITLEQQRRIEEAEKELKKAIVHWVDSKVGGSR